MSCAEALETEKLASRAKPANTETTDLMIDPPPEKENGTLFQIINKVHTQVRYA
jgi:hypothetical protein